MRRSKPRKAIAWLVLIVSTLFGVIAAYSLLFAIWMTAHPLYDSPAWERVVYERFAIVLVDALIWFSSVMWLFRCASQDTKDSITPKQ